MRILTLFIALLVFSQVTSQTTSLRELLKKRKLGIASQPTLNCVKKDQKQNCLQCVPKYELKNGKCSLIMGSSNVNSDVKETGDDCLQGCGEARFFRDLNELDLFIAKHKSEIGVFEQFLTPLPIPVRSGPIMNEASPANIRPLSNFISSDQIKSSSSPQMDVGRSIAQEGPQDTKKQKRQFSKTNNNKVEVDEADILKSDGTYIYTISNRILAIILGYPAHQAKVVSKINLRDMEPAAIFIEGDSLAVFGSKRENIRYSFRQFYFIRPSNRYERTDYTYIKIYNISNRAAPFTIKEFYVSGRYFDGRKLENGFVYLVTNHDFSQAERPWIDFRNRRVYVSPRSIYWYPSYEYQSLMGINIISFNLANPSESDQKVVSICSQQANILYMTEKNIFISTQLGSSTGITKITISKKKIVPFAEGIVRGSVKNQFSFDESGEFLRVAATYQNGFQTANAVYVLDNRLKLKSSLLGIAPTQTIYSTRYAGNRLYMVTFRKIDPFFVISFKDDTTPQILGQLKITGYSNYLHPYDENTVIGLGRQSQLNGNLLGLKISLFDVEDVEKPRETTKFELEEKYANSNAEWQHKAFLFSSQKNLMVIPCSMNSLVDKQKFNGALAFYISKKEITLRSLIDHILRPNDNYNDRNVQRSLWIENFLYTKSKCLLRINKISENFEGILNLKIPCQEFQEAWQQYDNTEPKPNLKKFSISDFVYYPGSD